MRYLTVLDSVEYSTLSKSRLYEAIKAGQLRVHKVGRRTVIREDELRRFIEGDEGDEVTR